jgi:uncharacterized protein YbjT (DUF2867 family)
MSETRGAARDAHTAVLLGATGLVGGHCLDLLLADERWTRVTVLGRRASGRSHPRLREQVGELSGMQRHAGAFAGARVFCCLGTTIRQAGSQDAFFKVDHDLPLAAARVASQAGASAFFLVSSLGADPESRVFYNRVKGETERDITALPLSAVVLVRPSLLLGERPGRRLAEGIGQALAPLAAPLLRGRLRRYRPIPGRAVAVAMLRLAAQGVSGVRVVESEEIAALAG